MTANGAIRPPREDGMVVVLLLLVMFTSAADLLIMTPILPAIAQDLRVGPDLGGLWVTAYAVATGLSALAFGPVSDRYGRRLVLRSGMLVLLVGTMACAGASSFLMMLSARFVAGAGAGMLVISTTSFAGDHFEPNRRAVVMSWVMSGFFLSLIMAVPLGAFLAGQFGWSRMFLILSAFALLIFVGLLFIPQPRYESRAGRLSVGHAARAYSELLRDRRVGGVLLMSLSIGLAMTMFSVYSSPWLAKNFGLNTAERGLVYAVGGPAVIVGGPIAGRLSNHFGRVSLVMAGSAVMGLMQLAMPFTSWVRNRLACMSNFESFSSFGDQPWPVALPAFAVFFFVMAAAATRSGPFQTLALEVAPNDRRGAVSALRNSFNQLGSGIGAATGGFLWSRLDPAFGTICLVAGFTTFLGAFALLKLVGSDRPA